MSTQTETRAATRVPASAGRLAWRRRWDGWADAWRQFRRSRSGMTGLVLLAIILALALLAPVISDAAVLDPSRTELLPNRPPSWGHPLGTDPLGRPILTMLLWGSRISLLIGITSTLVSVVIGTVVGVFAGHYRGWGGAVFLRIIDFFLVIPGLVLAIVLASVLHGGVLTIIVAVGVTSWAGTARLIRAQTLTLEARPYVERSVALGAGSMHVVWKHIIPGVMPLVLTSTTLTVGGAIIAEATLAFLGISDGATASWGAMLQLALGSGAAVAGYWWLVVAPGAAIVVVVLAFTLVGRALETIVNPTLRSR